MAERIGPLMATMVAPTCDAMVQLLGKVSKGWIEIRFDSFWKTVPSPDQAEQDVLKLLAAKQPGVRLLATLRPIRQGGRFDGEDLVRLNLLKALGHAGFDAIDLEGDYEHPSQVREALQLPDSVGLVASDHRDPRVPSRERGMLQMQSLQDVGGQVDKVAYSVGSFQEQLRAIELVHQHAMRGGRPALQPLDQAADFRSLLALVGNHLTYGHHPLSSPAVSGQPSTGAIQSVWKHWGLNLDRIQQLTPGGGWYAVLGNPVEHSLSPRIHNALFAAKSWTHGYGHLRMPDSVASMRLLWSVSNRLGLRGANVTSPLKRHAYDAVSWRSEEAERVKAVNTIVMDGRHVKGYNTDVLALERILSKRLVGAPRGQVVVLGGGDAARSFLPVLEQEFHFVDVVVRDPVKVRAEIKNSELRGLLDRNVRILGWNDCPRAADLVINTTPTDQIPPVAAPATLELQYVMPSGLLPGEHHVGPKEFLVEQAILAHQLWNPELSYEEARSILSDVEGVQFVEGYCDD